MCVMKQLYVVIENKTGLTKTLKELTEAAYNCTFHVTHHLEAGRVQIRRKGLNARFLIRNKAQSPRILDQVAQFISH